MVKHKTAAALKSVPLQEFNEGYDAALHWFFSFPQKEMSLNDLVSELNISKTTAHRVVESLVKEGFLRKEVLGRTWRITCEQAHVYNFSRKILFNLRMVYESDILTQINQIIPSSRAVVLFGSYRKGDDNEKSDIDIAVEVLDGEELRIVPLGTFEKFGYRTKVLVNLHIFSRNNIDLNLFANIANGIVMQGFLEVRP